MDVWLKSKVETLTYVEGYPISVSELCALLLPLGVFVALVFIRLGKPNKETAKKIYGSYLTIGFAFFISGPIFDLIWMRELNPLELLLASIFFIAGSGASKELEQVSTLPGHTANPGARLYVSIREILLSPQRCDLPKTEKIRGV